MGGLEQPAESIVGVGVAGPGAGIVVLVGSSEPVSAIPWGTRPEVQAWFSLPGAAMTMDLESRTSAAEAAVCQGILRHG